MKQYLDLLRHVLKAGISLLAGPPKGAWVEVGCSTGGACFELFEPPGKVVDDFAVYFVAGADFDFVQSAQHVAYPAAWARRFAELAAQHESATTIEGSALLAEVRGENARAVRGGTWANSAPMWMTNTARIVRTARYYSENRQGGISSIMEAPGEMTYGVIYSQGS